jgi:pimeloyl-ACP methyl ester carboxylesterase
MASGSQAKVKTDFRGSERTPNLPPVLHKTLNLNGIEIFYREAGPAGAPAILLPHGYPCSSFQYRALMPMLADRWHLVAPDYPGFGYTGTPDERHFDYNFDGYADFLDQFAAARGLKRYALYLHDYGSQIGLRHAIARPERITALIIQNGDIYEDALGPKYEAIKRYWSDPSPSNRKTLEGAVSEEGFRDEFVGEVSDTVAERMPPDLWKLHWPLMNKPVRREVAVRLMEGLKDNLDWFPRYQAYLRENRPPTLIIWGPMDGYMPASAARAYLRDLPDAELHLFDDAGHWLLETHLDAVVPLVRGFLDRADARRSR